MRDYLEDSPYLKRLQDTAQEVITEYRCIYCGERFLEYEAASNHVLECRQKNSIETYKIDYGYDIDGSESDGRIYSMKKLRIPRTLLDEYLDKKESKIEYGRILVTLYSTSVSDSAIQDLLRDCKEIVLQKVNKISKNVQSINTENTGFCYSLKKLLRLS